MNKEIIEQMIKAGMPNAEVIVSGDDGQHFEALVISDEFEGMRLLQRHQAVYRTLGEQMGHEIHALRLKTVTPEEHHNAASE